MQITVVEKQQVYLRGSTATDTSELQLGDYIDVSNFSSVWVCVGYRDLTVSGGPTCLIKVYPAWSRGRDTETLIDTTTVLSTADLGAASDGSGLVIDESTTGLLGAVRAPGVVVKLEFTPSTTAAESVTAEIGVSLIAST